MLRRILTAYLAVLTVAAPCLCCCAPGRLFAAPAPRAAEPAQSCCRRHIPRPAPTPQPSNPDPQDRCPCREHSQKQAVVGPAAEFGVARQLVGPSYLLPALLNPDIPILGPRTSAFGFDCRNPFPSAFDLLHVHHRLRC
jgi:hypothetical protein